AVDALAPGCVKDAPAAEPEGDVVGRIVAVRDEVARPRLVDLAARVLLLVGVAGHDPAGAPVGHVDEAGAVDPALCQPAPEIRCAEVGARLLDRVAAFERLRPHPARVVVDGAHAGPAVTPLLDGQRLAGERLGDLL